MLTLEWDCRSSDWNQELDICDEESLKELKEEDLRAEKKADKIRELTNLYGTQKSITRVCLLFLFKLLKEISYFFFSMTENQ